MTEFITTIVLTFALAMVVLGAITFWLERNKRRLLGVALAVVGILVGATYSFLASRYSEEIFGRLIVAVDLPALMATALANIIGVIGGGGLAAGVVLWATGRFRQRMGRAVVAVIVVGVLVAIAATVLAVSLSAG
ncbi:MAG: hypothetical protein E3J64_09665 [Anaerolineales bacterium]|nr:MAG: hypothetical protein E3J64_09665 [Anaerolineales bacterium]